MNTTEGRNFLPFLVVFHAAIRDGTKTATTRSKAYGKAGDIVDSPVGPLRLLSVDRVPLKVVRNEWWREEGVDSPQAFEDIWRQIHPGTGYQPDVVKVLHVFERVVIAESRQVVAGDQRFETSLVGGNLDDEKVLASLDALVIEPEAPFGIKAESFEVCYYCGKRILDGETVRQVGSSTFHPSCKQVKP